MMAIFNKRKSSGNKGNAAGEKTVMVFKNRYIEALSISSVYAAFGMLWILLSDRILGFFVKNDETYKEFQTFKGWFYIFITAILVYILIRNRLKQIQEEFNRTEKAYEQLRKVHEEMMSLESELIFQKNLNESIILEAPAIIVTWNDDGIINSMNPFGLRCLGYLNEDIQAGLRWEDLIAPDRQTELMRILSEIIKKKQLINFEGTVLTKDGKSINILWSSKQLTSKDSAVKNSYVSIGTDIEERKRYEERVRYLAFYDSLTGLPNRAMFENEINAHLEQESRFIIAYIDIDNFKNINDSLGHHVGDLFLRYLANCLREEIKEPDFVARLGGDEFAILYSEEEKDVVPQRLEAIINSISKTWTIENSQFYITMSIGVVVCPEHGDNASTLLKNADIAMYEAKRGGKNRVFFYEEEIQEHNDWHIKTINNLQYAIECEQFMLVFQPQFNLVTGGITGMEALVRWIHPTEGVISPGVFIPLAEQTGQIYSLERWIFRKALEQKAEWERQGYSELILSINLSSKTLTSKLNFDELEAILSDISVNYSNIVIEITETASISEVGTVISHLERLKKFGIKIALDDFGTGYSSLNYLKKFPIDIVKLDRSFINSIAEEGIDTLLIKNILALAHDLKYEVVAEGIETKEQLEYLRSFACESGQGFLLSKPLPEENIRKLLQENYTYCI
jgi:diguanylate cyclase (GGDEF)-like protein/PAS domain S-box-containing protein